MHFSSLPENISNNEEIKRGVQTLNIVFIVYINRWGKKILPFQLDERVRTYQFSKQYGDRF